MTFFHTSQVQNHSEYMTTNDVIELDTHVTGLGVCDSRRVRGE